MGEINCVNRGISAAKRPIDRPVEFAPVEESEFPRVAAARGVVPEVGVPAVGATAVVSGDAVMLMFESGAAAPMLLLNEELWGIGASLCEGCCGEELVEIDPASGDG